MNAAECNKLNIQEATAPDIQKKKEKVPLHSLKNNNSNNNNSFYRRGNK